jgi:hypothetical protein
MLNITRKISKIVKNVLKHTFLGLGNAIHTKTGNQRPVLEIA